MNADKIEAYLCLSIGDLLVSVVLFSQPPACTTSQGVLAVGTSICGP
jgi:hypothetical protein